MKTKIFLIAALLSTLYFSIVPTPVSANLFEDFLNDMNKKLQDGVEGVKDMVVSKKENRALTLESEIKLAEGGDVNKNDEIDAGDTITFVYNLHNNTDKKYAYATLKTNIQRNSLNYIRHVTGVTGLKDNGETIEFPNLRVEPGMVKQLSFDATINYFTESDPVLFTEPELVSEEKQSLMKAVKKQIKVKRIKKEDIPAQIQMFKKNP